MRISYKTDYALKALLELALNPKSELQTITGLAEKLDIPKKFLEQILLELKKGGFVTSRRGKEGGYLLAKKSAAITIGDVLRYIEGSLDPIACVDDHYKGCASISCCIFRDLWKKLASSISNVVDNATLESLANEVQRRQKVVEYSI